MKKAWRYRKGTLLHYKGTEVWMESYFIKTGRRTWVRAYDYRGASYPLIYTNRGVQAHIDQNQLTIIWEG